MLDCINEFKVIVKRFDCPYRISLRYSQKNYSQTLYLYPNYRYTKSRVGQKNSNNSQNLRTVEGIPILYLSAPISTEATAFFVNLKEIVIFIVAGYTRSLIAYVYTNIKFPAHKFCNVAHKSRLHLQDTHIYNFDDCFHIRNCWFSHKLHPQSIDQAPKDE